MATPMIGGANIFKRCAAAAALFFSFVSTPCFGVIEEFESPQRTWDVREHDCAISVERHHRSFGEAHTGNGCEYLRYTASQGGTKVLIAHTIPGARVIDELTPSLWIKSTRPGLQLSVRVVLPNSRDPKTGRPVTRLLPGESYSTAGTWQQLTVRDLPLLLQRQVRFLRAEFGPEVDQTEAYIDMLVLNIYAGAGGNELWLDDLEVRGFAAATRLANDADPGALVPTSTQRPNQRIVDGGVPRVRGPLLYVNSRPFFARAIQWQGEPFDLLAEMGFNVIALPHAPTPDQVEEASALDLWLTSPPPGEEESETDPRRTICWSLGAALTAENAGATGEAISRLRRSGRDDRPVICDVARDFSRFAGIADLLLVNERPVGTSFELSHLPGRIQGTVGQIRPATPFWVGVQTEFSVAHRAQIAGFQPGQVLDVDVEAEQIWLQALYAAASGARGIVFRSQSRLDGQGPAARRRAAAIEIINHWLSIIEPWVAGGKSGRPIDLATPGFFATTLRTERSRLVMVCRVAADQQFVIGPGPNIPTITVPVPGMLSSDQPQRILASGMQPIRAVGGLSGTVRVDTPGLFSFVVLTDDSLVRSHLQSRTAEVHQRLLQKQAELASYQLSETGDVLRELAYLGRAMSNSQQSLERAERMLEYSRQVIAGRDFRKTESQLRETQETLRKLRHQHWRDATMEFPSPISSPLCSSFRTLPAHWSMAKRLSGSRWGPNEMAAGGFESLPHLLRSGWIKQESQIPAVDAQVELSLELPKSGRQSLKLQAWSRLTRPKLEHWPVWLTSASVPVRAGELIQISGFVNVPEPIESNQDALIIFDTISGIDHATRVRVTRGWQDFRLYRAVPHHGEVAVVIALAGIGTAYVDDLQLMKVE